VKELYSVSEERASPYPMTPSQHASLLHPLKSKGRVCVGRLTPRWKPEWYEPWELEDALYDVAGEPDVYVSMNRFKRTRHEENVHELAALYSDVDFYKVSELAGLAPEVVYEKMLRRLEDAGIPEPSLALFSGRGLQADWLLRPVGSKELPRWKDCQRALWQVLRPLGADRASLDASRVLRLAGTRNSKTGASVRTLGGTGEVLSFDEFAKRLPQVQEDEEHREGAELHDMRVQRAARGGYKAPRCFTVQSLWEERLSDLHTLRRLRFGQEQMPDFRDRWLLLAAVAMSWITAAPVLPEGDLFALAAEAGGWDRRTSRSQLQEVFERMERLARGEKIEFEGTLWDPRYHYKHETIIELLEITPGEQRHMSTIIDDEESRRRDREYRRERRRTEGVRPRGQYDQDRATDRQKKIATARTLKECGLSTKEIAQAMELSERQVQRLLQAKA